MIVIIIIGILIAALLPRLTGSQARARDTARMAGVNQIANGLALLINDQGSILTGAGGICINNISALSGASASLSGYLATLPVDPQPTHSNVAALSPVTTCAGYYGVIMAADGRSAMVFTDLETTNGANVGTLGAYVSMNSLTGMQAYITSGGSSYFGALVQG
ncbi:hypothetical protein KA013_04690 [Patescibacteria group bacterium]|nr:hypothetical protein [Patescibacteria group bacterium]